MYLLDTKLQWKFTFWCRILDRLSQKAEKGGCTDIGVKLQPPIYRYYAFFWEHRLTTIILILFYVSKSFLLKATWHSVAAVHIQIIP